MSDIKDNDWEQLTFTVPYPNLDSIIIDEQRLIDEEEQAEESDFTLLESEENGEANSFNLAAELEEGGINSDDGFEDIEVEEVAELPFLDYESYQPSSQRKHVSEKVKRQFPLLFERIKRRKFPFLGIYIVPENRAVYLANVTRYWKAYPLFFYSLYKVLVPQLIEFFLIFASIYCLRQIGLTFNLFSHIYVIYLFRFLLISSLVYSVLCLKLLLTKVLFYYMSHLQGFSEQNGIHLNLLKLMVSRYERQTSSKDPTLYYKQLRDFSQLVDFDDFKIARLNLLLEHRVDWRKSFEMESSSLILEDDAIDNGEDITKMFIYFKHLLELDIDNLDLKSCYFILKHLNELKKSYHPSSLLPIIRACLQFYPQLSEGNKKYLLSSITELSVQNQKDLELIKQLSKEEI